MLYRYYCVNLQNIHQNLQKIWDFVLSPFHSQNVAGHIGKVSICKTYSIFKIENKSGSRFGFMHYLVQTY